jgi:hypothetical protein
MCVLLTSSSIFSYPYSNPLHFPSFSCNTIHCSLSQLLLLPLFIHSFPSLHLPPIFPQPVTSLPLPPTESSSTNQSTVPTVHPPNPLQSLTQAPSTTTVEIHPNTHKGLKTQQSITSSSIHPLFQPILLVPPLPITQVFIFSQITSSPPNCHCLLISSPRGFLYNM